MNTQNPRIMTLAYNPISFDVIEQAVDKMGLPKPKAMSREGMAYKWPNGDISANYKVVFSLPQVKKYCNILRVANDGDLWKFRNDLHDSFCDDITLVELHAGTSIVTAKLYVKVERHGK